jgi:hypothetical protein
MWDSQDPAVPEALVAAKGSVCGAATNREISKDWDAAWMKFAAEELEMKNNKKHKRKRDHVDVLPKYEDVLGIGETEGIKNGLTGAVLEEETELLCVQRDEV